METTVMNNNDTREVINKGLTSFGSLMTRADKIQQKCVDYNVTSVTLKNCRFNDMGMLTFVPDGGTINSLPLSRFALGQLGSKIGVPADYLQKCIDTGRLDLCRDNVNSWLDTCGKDFFLREYDGRLRGVLSSRYSVLDTPDILDTIDDAIDTSQYKIKGFFLNEERLHLRLVGKQMLPVNGEDLFPGIFIDSSDVGRNVLTVQFGIYKQVCTNGLVVSRGSGKLFEQKHVGIKAEEFHEGLVSSLKSVEVLCANAVDLVNSAMTKKGGAYAVSMLSPEDFEAFVHRIKGSTQLSTEGAEKVIDLMQTKYGESKWGYINSITEVAQDYTLERRLKLERIAGEMLLAA